MEQQMFSYMVVVLIVCGVAVVGITIAVSILAIVIRALHTYIFGDSDYCKCCGRKK